MNEPRPKKTPEPSSQPPNPAQENLTLAAIQAAVASIRHGIVQIIIQDGRIVQIDKTEKIRLV